MCTTSAFPFVYDVMSQSKPKSTRTLAFFFVFTVLVVVFLLYYVQAGKETPDYEAPHLNLDVSLQEKDEQEMEKLSLSLGQMKALLNYTSKVISHCMFFFLQ